MTVLSLRLPNIHSVLLSLCCLTSQLHLCSENLITSSEPLLRNTTKYMMYAFVYGTLKRNCPNNYVLNNPENGTSKFISEGRTTDLFPLIVATELFIPFLLDKKGTGKRISGEVYEIDEKMLKFLDNFEQNPSIYIRRDEIIELIPSGEIIAAGVYTFHSFLPEFLNEPFIENYLCSNYDILRSLSGKLDELRKGILYKLRGEKYYENQEEKLRSIYQINVLKRFF